MSQILEATFDGEVFRPTEAVELPPDTQVHLVVTLKATSQEKPASFLRTARSLKLQGPKDWSSRIDDCHDGGATVDADTHFQQAGFRALLHEQSMI